MYNQDMNDEQTAILKKVRYISNELQTLWRAHDRPLFMAAEEANQAINKIMREQKMEGNDLKVFTDTVAKLQRQTEQTGQKFSQSPDPRLRRHADQTLEHVRQLKRVSAELGDINMKAERPHLQELDNTSELIQEPGKPGPSQDSLSL